MPSRKPRMRNQVKPARMDAADGRNGSAPIPGDATVQGQGSLLDRRDALMRKREAEAHLRRAAANRLLDRRDALMRARERAKASEETRRRLRAKGLIK